MINTGQWLKANVETIYLPEDENGDPKELTHIMDAILPDGKVIEINKYYISDSITVHTKEIDVYDYLELKEKGNDGDNMRGK